MDYDNNKKRPWNASNKGTNKLPRRTRGRLTDNISQWTMIAEVHAATRYWDTYHRYYTTNNINPTSNMGKIKIIEHTLNTYNCTHFTGQRHVHKRGEYRDERLERLPAEEAPAGILGINRSKKS